MSQALLLVPNHPAFYPHVARHAAALRTRYDRVLVVAMFAPDEALPSLEGVAFLSGAPGFVNGVRGFLLWMIHVFKIVRQHPADAVEAIDPPCLIPAALALLFRKTRLVYFSMEIFAQTPALQGRWIKSGIWACLEKLSVRRAQKVLTVNDSVAEILQNFLHQNSVGVVRSIPERRTLTPRDGRLRALCGLGPADFLLVYQGYLEQGRGIDCVADCLQKRPHLHLVILGFGPLQEWCQARAQQQRNVHYCGAHPFPELMALAHDADAGLVWIEPISESYRLSLPGKVFEYVQNGLPILGSPLPEISRVIREYAIGEVAQAQTAESLLQSLDALVAGVTQGLYQTGLERAHQELCWEKEQLRLLTAFGEG